MRKLFFLLMAAALFVSCGSSKDKTKDDDEVPTDESSLGSWSDEDKGKLKKEWAKTFATWKDGLQGEDDFDEAGFDTEAKKSGELYAECFGK